MYSYYFYCFDILFLSIYNLGWSIKSNFFKFFNDLLNKKLAFDIAYSCVLFLLLIFYLLTALTDPTDPNIKYGNRYENKDE